MEVPFTLVHGGASVRDRPYVLGVNAGHDATAVLVRGDGEIVAAVAEERLSRFKFHTGFPFQAVELVLRMGAVAPGEVRAVALPTKRLLYPGLDHHNHLFFERSADAQRALDGVPGGHGVESWPHVWEAFKKNLGLGAASSDPPAFLRASEDLTRGTLAAHFQALGFDPATVATFEHHLCHAASVYYSSDAADPLVVTVDGAGDGLCATVSVVEGGRIRRLSEAPSNCSPGRFYSEITRFLGFRWNRHEGKITGLAAFGRPEVFRQQLSRFLQFRPTDECFGFEAAPDPVLVRKLKTVLRILNNENFGNPYVDTFHAYLKRTFDPKKDAQNLAAAAQAVLEDCVVSYVRHFLLRAPRRQVLLAGGVFANVRVNQKVAEMHEVDRVYVHPNMGDGGGALGAALLQVHEAERRPYRLGRLSDVYFGPSFTDDEIRRVLDAERVSFESPDDIEQRVAQLIHEGMVIGRFHGRMEYGPRALGNRSILARPTHRLINDWLNKRLHRTEFMPFAPSVLASQAGALFEGYDGGKSEHASHFMTITYSVRPEWQTRLQAATHVDGTARPQVVTREQNQSLWGIIDAYYRLSGIPAVINTSFNMHEEPIVATPGDAVRAFKQGCLDYLAIGNSLCPYPGERAEDPR